MYCNLFGKECIEGFCSATPEHRLCEHKEKQQSPQAEQDTGIVLEHNADQLGLSAVTDYTPWRFFADGCPWKRFEDGIGLCCSGNIDDCNVYGPCHEDDCTPYHFVKKCL